MTAILRRGLRLAFVICLIAVAWLSLSPPSDLPSVSLWDKLGHLLAYTALAVLGGLGLARRDAAPLVGLGVGLCVYGALLEAGQSFVEGRTPSLADELANALGVLAGLLVVQATGSIARWAQRRP